MGTLILVFLIVNPVVWLVMNYCHRQVQIIIGIITWLAFMWFAGECCRTATGQPWHGLHMIISVIFVLIAKFMTWITDLGYGQYHCSRNDDDDLVISPRNFWHPWNVWHDGNDDEGER